jgi:hypothetical protein
MSWREHQHRSPGRTSSDVWTPALTVVAAILLTACLGAMAIVQLERFGPQVGAIVVFKPGPPRMDLWHIRASAADSVGHYPDSGATSRTCILSPSTMAEGGGSLIVEARRMSSPPLYRVHWAGSRTSNGGDDCGRKADLVLSRTDLQKLANSAGGYGAGPKAIGP